MVKIFYVLNILLLISGCSEAYASDVETLILQEANLQGIDSRIAIAVARVESSLNQNARGSKGEIGVFQVMPYNAPIASLYDLKGNIHAGILLLKRSKLQCSDMGQYWVVCYNNGANRRPKYPNLHPYYKRVLASLRGN